MKTLSDTIVLNKTFDAYEEGVDLLQFRFALAMYAVTFLLQNASELFCLKES